MGLLASIAQVPQYHFDFIFHSLFHTNIDDYIALLRNLEVAQQLGFDKSISIAKVAQSAGYQSEIAFVKAFSKSIGQSPQQFQQSPDWGNFFAKQQPLKTLSEGHEELSASDVNIEIVDLDSIALIVIKHRTLAEYLPQTIQAMRAFRQAHQLTAATSQTFNFIYQSTAAANEQYNIDIAVSINDTQKTALKSLIESSEFFYFDEIPKGRFASFIHTGSDEALHKKLKYLYGTWLIAQNKKESVELKDIPLIFEKVNITEPDKQQTRVYLALV
nr:GyrI-like domain-containing protein [Shewanella olleyana]